MQIIDLNAALAGLGAIALGLGGLIIVGRDRTADEHDVSDYRDTDVVWAEGYSVCDGEPDADTSTPTVSAVRRDWPVLDRDESAQHRPVEARTEPAELAPWTVPWTPPYADLVVAQVLRRYGDSPADRAARMLREIADEQRALAGAR